MKELNIGVIGTGAIGREHIERINNKLQKAHVVAVTDINAESGKKVAEQYHARFENNGEAVVNAADVDAIVVTSWGPAHAESVLQAIAAGKPVFCEKPLATTAEDCKKIVDSEIAAGKKLVQVGFMRRYDKGYLQIKSAIDSSALGKPLLLHCTHRNANVDTSYTTDMAVSDTAIHEIDVLHWLVGDEYESVQVITGRNTKYSHSNLQDPQLMVIKTKEGVMIELEVFVNCKFGYDIQCQVVCEDGVIQMADPSYPMIKKNGIKSVEIEQDWKRRFADAYDVEIQEWIDSTLKGKMNGPSSWDGYLAAVTADALIKSQSTAQMEPVSTGIRPSFYD